MGSPRCSNAVYGAGGMEFEFALEFEIKGEQPSELTTQGEINCL